MSQVNSDATTTVAELKKLIGDFVAERDWSQFHSPKNVSMALAIEVAELMEHFQWLTTEASRRIIDDPEKLAAVGEELADVVGYYDDGDLTFAGKVGTGFDTRLLRDLRQRLGALELPASPFSKATGLPKIRVHWVRPEIVVQVAFIEWTSHGKLRHPRLIGVREDKRPVDVVREGP